MTSFRDFGILPTGLRAPEARVRAEFAAAQAAGDAREISLVFSSDLYRNEAELDAMLQGGQVTGICTSEPRTSWGATLGPNISQANGGLPLNGAWEIEELREPPTAAAMQAWWGAAAASMAGAVLLTGLTLWIARPE